MNPFSHIDLRVDSMAKCLPFYRALLAEFGFGDPTSSGEWEIFVGEGEYPSVAFFSIIEEVAHRPNGNRIALWAGSRDEVDAIGALLREIGASIESGPRLCSEYNDGYYAVFFEDPAGNLLEVVHRTE
ncbi:MAG TPA: VOC family protein [Acidobacteriota bacterium]|nr:VOC family protein [Acidobacteriota bacterium]